VNYQEATKDEPAFYGVIVLWDIAVFFIWLRCLDLAKDASETKFFSFSLVAVAPFLKLGREILLLPYAKWNLNSCHEDLIGPYLDLLFGDLTVCTWIVIALHRSNGFRKKRIDRLNLAAKHLVFTGCVYWILRGVRNVLDFLAPQYSAAECSWLGNRLWYLSFAYFIVALAITVAVSKKNIFGLGTYFGLPRSSSRGADQY